MASKDTVYIKLLKTIIPELSKDETDKLKGMLKSEEGKIQANIINQFSKMTKIRTKAITSKLTNFESELEMMQSNDGEELESFYRFTFGDLELNFYSLYDPKSEELFKHEVTIEDLKKDEIIESYVLWYEIEGYEKNDDDNDNDIEENEFIVDLDEYNKKIAMNDFNFDTLFKTILKKLEIKPTKPNMNALKQLFDFSLIKLTSHKGYKFPVAKSTKPKTNVRTTRTQPTRKGTAGAAKSTNRGRSGKGRARNTLK